MTLENFFTGLAGGVLGALIVIAIKTRKYIPLIDPGPKSEATTG